MHINRAIKLLRNILERHVEANFSSGQASKNHAQTIENHLTEIRTAFEAFANGRNTKSQAIFWPKGLKHGFENGEAVILNSPVRQDYGTKPAEYGSEKDVPILALIFDKKTPPLSHGGRAKCNVYFKWVPDEPSV